MWAAPQPNEVAGVVFKTKIMDRISSLLIIIGNIIGAILFVETIYEYMVHGIQPSNFRVLLILLLLLNPYGNDNTGTSKHSQ